jgi:hypothetical protein
VPSAYFCIIFWVEFRFACVFRFLVLGVEHMPIQWLTIRWASDTMNKATWTMVLHVPTEMEDWHCDEPPRVTGTCNYIHTAQHLSFDHCS